jgi:TRAP-type C4-dicarboxylate transport system permease small subunit
LKLPKGQVWQHSINPLYDLSDILDLALWQDKRDGYPTQFMGRDTMDRFVAILLTGLICFVALGQFFQVITRYVLQIPVMGLEETMLYPTIWLYIFGAINASRENTHIRANVLEIFISSERAHTILAIVGEVISLIVGLWILSWAWDYTQYAWRVWRESPTLYIPTFYSDVALLVGVTLMMVYTAWHLVQHILTLKNGTVA